MGDGRIDATETLIAHSNGDRKAAARLLPLVYDQLRALAHRYMQQERPDHTLQTTALVHEAYVRLIDVDRVDWRGKTHFFAIAAREMRRVLVEHARSKKARKRGGGLKNVTLEDTHAIAPGSVVDVLALDEALERLQQQSPRQIRVVELRFFAGLSVEETARLLEVSEATVKGDWRMAKAWLSRELAPNR